MKAAIGLGSNLGDRARTLSEAVLRIDRVEGVRVVARSSIWETPPVGPPQPDYLNAVILVECTLSPRALLDALFAIEAELGRVRVGAERWGPRPIDLDVLFIEGRIVDEPGLTVPHPQLTTRAFALAPLLEVAPHAIDPRTDAPFTPLDASALEKTTHAL